MLCENIDTRYTISLEEEYRKRDIIIRAYYDLWEYDGEKFWGLVIKLVTENTSTHLYTEGKIKTLEEARDIARLYVENNFTTGLI